MEFEDDIPDFVCDLALTQFEISQRHSKENITNTMDKPKMESTSRKIATKPEKKFTIPVQSSPRQASQRFAEPVKTQEIEELAEKRIPENTKKNMNWAVKAFQEWRIARNKLFVTRLASDMPVDFLVPWDDLEKMSNEQWILILPAFLMEVRKQNGERYPSSSLFQMLVSIQAYIRMKHRDVSFLKDPTFKKIEDALDWQMKVSAKEALNKSQQADIITPEVEIRMWEDGLLGLDTPQKLIHTLMYLLGLNFALRASDHKNLNFNEQISVQTDSEGATFLQYEETTSKSSQGGLQTRKRERRISRAYANHLDPQRCPVRLYNLYCSKCPTENRPLQLYLQPLQSKELGSCWFARRPLGIHTIEGFMRKLTLPLGEEGRFTPHSLRATNATRLYRRGVPEQLIQEQTGHSSLAVRRYKRTSDVQKKEISSLLLPELEVSSKTKIPSKLSMNENYDSAEDFREEKPKKRKPSATVSRPPSPPILQAIPLELDQTLPDIEPPILDQPVNPIPAPTNMDAPRQERNQDEPIIPRNEVPNIPQVPPTFHVEPPQNPQPVPNPMARSNIEFNVDTERKVIYIKINF